MNVGVLGGGSTAYACAADLVLRGHDVRIFSHRAEELQPLCDAGGIEASGVISGFAAIDTTPIAIGELLDWAEIVLLNVSAGGFETYAHLIAQNAGKEQRIVSFGKGGASLILARVAREAGDPDTPTLCGGEQRVVSVPATGRGRCMDRPHHKRGCHRCISHSGDNCHTGHTA